MTWVLVRLRVYQVMIVASLSPIKSFITAARSVPMIFWLWLYHLLSHALKRLLALRSLLLLLLNITWILIVTRIDNLRFSIWKRLLVNVTTCPWSIILNRIVFSIHFQINIVYLLLLLEEICCCIWFLILLCLLTVVLYSPDNRSRDLLFVYSSTELNRLIIIIRLFIFVRILIWIEVVNYWVRRSIMLFSVRIIHRRRLRS
jgi:hypothetical protein